MGTATGPDQPIRHSGSGAPGGRNGARTTASSPAGASVGVVPARSIVQPSARSRDAATRSAVESPNARTTAPSSG
jgi:hypothetical protein